MYLQTFSDWLVSVNAFVFRLSFVLLYVATVRHRTYPDESLHVPENISAEDFESLVDADNQLECYQEQSSDEIVHVVESEDENSQEDAIIDPPTASETLQMIQKLRLFFGEDAELDFLEALSEIFDKIK